MLFFYVSMIMTEDEERLFTDFYLRMHRKCYYIANKITNDMQLAEDAVHNAFMKIITMMKKFFNLPQEERERLITTIVKNKAIDIVKSRKQTFEIMDDEIFPDSGSVSMDYENAESYKRLINSIKSLPEIYRMVFEMKYLHGKNNDEIAETLEITKDLVSQRLGRAKMKLKKMIETA